MVSNKVLVMRYFDAELTVDKVKHEDVRKRVKKQKR